MSPDPTILSVAPSNPQTWNRYTYVLDNPSTNIDTKGKWTTGEHEQIINDVFKFMSDGDRSILKAASAEVDQDQDPKDSYKHGMSSTNEDAFQASQDAGQWIDTNINEAVAAQLKWEDSASSPAEEAKRETENAPDALKFFGYALHTVTDVWSPEHVGFQTWHGYGDGSYASPDPRSYRPSRNDFRGLSHVIREWGSGISPLTTGAAARQMAEYEANLLWTLYQDKVNEARKKKGKKKPKTCGTCPSHMASVAINYPD